MARFLTGFCLIALILAGNKAFSQVEQFSVGNYAFRGEALVFDYITPYPGLTKVTLLDAEDRPVWRGQYVDNDGPQQVRFRAARLTPGEAYTFRFEYKAVT